MQAIDSFEFTQNGRAFLARIYSDDSADSPWEGEDGHGNVEFIGNREPVPRGWTVIYDDRHGRWIYDTGSAIVKARKEGWGIDESSRHYRPGMTRGQRTYAAVKADREYLAGYIRGDWCYVGVSVQPVGLDYDDFSRALWRIESWSTEYVREVAADLADEWGTE